MLCEVILDKKENYHFIGIGGIGMSALAFFMHNLDYRVKGSDLVNSYIIEKLRQEGIPVMIGHRKENVSANDIIIYSSAIANNNPELVEAQKMSLPIYHRSQILASLLSKYYVIAITGTHGKTTTTYLVTKLLLNNKINCGMLLGGWARDFNSNFLAGEEIYVVELDESDGSFINFNPNIKVITNIDDDHLESYNYNFQELCNKFKEFIKKEGINIICGDDKNLYKLREGKFITYGNSPNYIFSWQNLQCLPQGLKYQLFYKGKKYKDVEIKMIGEHLATNSLAAVAVLYTLRGDLDNVELNFDNLQGISRRMEIVYSSQQLEIIHDYAHHPLEIEKVLSALKKWYPWRRIIIVFQPHRYSRTKLLWHKFLQCFHLADDVYITDIYPAFEKAILGINSQRLAQEIKHSSVQYLPYQDIVKVLLKNIRDNDIILFLGAGDIHKLSYCLKDCFISRKK